MRLSGMWTKVAALSAVMAVAAPALNAQQGGARPAAAKPAATVPPKLDGYKKEVVADFEHQDVDAR